MRTDGDTWDITTSVGSTALFVAATRALEAQRDEPLALDPYAEVFVRAVGGVWSDLLDGKAPDHQLASPDFGVAFRAFQGGRTRYFDNYFHDAADAGVRQIVILAAGLDSRGYRLPWPDGTVIYELDQPQVQEFKREVLAEHGDRPTAERREIAVDLRDDWPQALRDSGFDPTRPSAWIAEGLLIYLKGTAQDKLFSGIDALAAPGSYVAVEDSAPMDPAALVAAREAERAAGREGTFFSLIYNEQHQPAADWFTARGWRAVATPLRTYLRDLGRPIPSLDSENPMIGDVSLVSAVKG
jgi:methyltransferase (TIGR00027 family)